MEAVGEVAGPVGEAKASTRDQAWRGADGRMGGRGEVDKARWRRDGARGEAKASTQNQAWRWPAGRMGGGQGLAGGANGGADGATNNRRRSGRPGVVFFIGFVGEFGSYVNLSGCEV